VLVLSASPRARRSPHGGIGILRSLGRLGIPVYTVDSNPRGPASFSKYVSGRFVFDLAAAAPEATVEFLLDVGRRIGSRAVLVPTWDDMAVLVSDHFEALSERFTFPHQPDGLARSLANKKDMYGLARKHFIPTPEASFPSSVEDVRSFAATATFPVMLKGISGNRLLVRTGRKMVIVDHPDELVRLYREMEDPADPNLMLQEYIPGGDDAVWMFNGYFNHHSDCVVGFTGRKLRQTPVYTGSTSLGICLQNDVVDETTRRWMKELGYRGVLDIGYRHDARDGRYKVLDVNPRIGGTFRLFVAQNGMDVARALYLDMTGQSVPVSDLIEGRRWMDERDVNSFLQYRRDHRLTLRQWVTSLKGVQETVYIARDDLAPLWKVSSYALGRALGRGLGLARTSLPSGANGTPARAEPPTVQSETRPQQIQTGHRQAVGSIHATAGPSMRMMHTERWLSDEAFELHWPADWSVSVLWPHLPPPLSTEQITAALRNPVGLPELADLCRGKRKPLVIIDDLSRPTPAASILDPLLSELKLAGVAPHQISILVATGTHPPPSDESISRKIGPTASRECRVVVHRDSVNGVRIGTTRFGTPIIVDREIVDADWVIGIGGVYPNNTAGFGGGSKLALGILARESIVHLHEKHRPAGWGRDNGSHSFRKDLDEIAAAIRLSALVTIHVDEEARPVRVVFGDHRAYYAEEMKWAAAMYRVAAPGDADVVVSNAYPNDSTLVSARHKGYAPLRMSRPDASRVVLASCHEGPGGHGLFPLVDQRTLPERIRRKASVMSLSQLAAAITDGVRRRLAIKARPFAWPVLLYRPGTGPKPDLPRLEGMEVASSWEAAIATIRAQHPGVKELRVVVYPCAPLQVLDSPQP
jgi:predicted ATP-grasp superfamily ATP-dependent carboligase/nickel-dependent lactate racemase